MEILEFEFLDLLDLVKVEWKGIFVVSCMRGYIIRVKVLRYLVSKKERI